MSHRRTRPAKLVTLAPETWVRVDELAARWGTSRSGAIERLVREVEMPRPRTIGAKRESESH
jgi:predicted DNA-binding transcriptional regulator AlpA